MNSIFKFFISLALALILINNCYALENLFYLLRSNAPDKIISARDAQTSIMNHYKNINILVSQAYQLNASGLVWGYINPDILHFTKQHNIKLFVLVTNAKFDKQTAHQFLQNSSAQKRALQTILEVCDHYHYDGVQFDLEMIDMNDRNALTRFYQTAADDLHKKGYKVSFALAPVLTDSLIASDFQKRIYENWEAAYDFQALGKAADFVTIMTYNQHAGVTTPGPTAGVRWVEAALQYALKFIPADKVSVGIPVYSEYWYTGVESGKANAQFAGINYAKVDYLLKKFNVHLQWDDNDKVNYAYYQNNWLNEYIFVEDGRSFKAKLDLAKKYHLRGVSVFYIGSEDPRIWDVLSL